MTTVRKAKGLNPKAMPLLLAAIGVIHMIGGLSAPSMRAVPTVGNSVVAWGAVLTVLSIVSIWRDFFRKPLLICVFVVAPFLGSVWKLYRGDAFDVFILLALAVAGGWFAWLQSQTV